MSSSAISPLTTLEPRLRWLLPGSLYADAWLDPGPRTLGQVFDHLRTLLKVLQDYTPRHFAEAPPRPGEVWCQWQEGVLMFTDLAGFTTLMEANVQHGRAGAEQLFDVLNRYFARMIEIISKFGGNLLEFTGDAMLVHFPDDQRRQPAARAINAGLRMQRAMAEFATIETASGPVALAMRLGLHRARFLLANIGTPRRMEAILLGSAIQRTKHAEGSGCVGRVCLTDALWPEVEALFQLEPRDAAHALVVDNLSDEQIGEYDIGRPQRRLGSPVLLDRTVEGLLGTIEETIRLIEPLASYLPGDVLKLVVNSLARRRIPPDFFAPSIMFIALDGLSEAANALADGEELELVTGFSRAFTLINAIVEGQGGILKKVTYHAAGSEVLIYFSDARSGDAERALSTALAIGALFQRFNPPTVGGRQHPMTWRIGLARGPVFAAEIGEPNGRREFNLLGDPVNTAARLASLAQPNQVLITDAVRALVGERFGCRPLGATSLKGKITQTEVFVVEQE